MFNMRSRGRLNGGVESSWLLQIWLRNFSGASHLLPIYRLDCLNKGKGGARGTVRLPGKNALFIARLIAFLRMGHASECAL